MFETVEPGKYEPLNNQLKKMRKLIDLPKSTVAELKIQAKGVAPNLKVKGYIEYILSDIAHSKRTYKPQKPKHK